MWCQQLPPRQDLTNTTGALVALCWKSATVADTVARLRQMEEDFSLGRTERLVKQMFTQTHRSLATVHRKYAIYILIPMQGCQKARYLAYTPKDRYILRYIFSLCVQGILVQGILVATLTTSDPDGDDGDFYSNITM